MAGKLGKGLALSVWHLFSVTTGQPLSQRIDIL